MAKSVLELAVGTGQWDAGLKKAKNALDNFTQANGGLQSALNKDSKSMQTFVQMMGKMDSTAKTAKGQMNDYKGTIEQLTMQYNRMTDAQKAAVGQTYLQAIDQMKQKYQGVAQEVAKINQELKQTNELSAGTGSGGGGLFSGDKLSGMLQVFGGNVMTKVAGMGVGLVSELGDMVKQGIELARAGEGIRIAFERLNKPGLLDNLREATHGTVTDLELMKAAVKFNDFKLPVEELGTMLAFAQQKAKDTGQSVDYMVDSIVTGLGRKSLMILDNLGLSAAEIKERMAETGDMTKAVGAIIREQMAKAGDYVETAADRATQANVSLQNKMEELGRKFGPLEQASSNLWTSIKIGIMDIVGGPLTDFLNKLTEAGRLAQKYSVLGGSGKVGRMINNLSGAREGNRQSIYQQQQEQFWRYINPREQQIRDIRAWQRGERGEALQKRVSAITEKYGSLDATKIQAEVDAAKKMLAEYQQSAKQILSPVKTDIKTDEAEQNVVSLTNKLKDLQAQRKKAIAAGDTELSKNLLKQINQTKADIKGLGGTTTTTTKHQTPQQRAQESFTKAEQNYKQALEQAAMELQAGTITRAEAKKKEMQAAEQRWKAIGDARNINDSENLRKAQDEAAANYKALAAEVKQMDDVIKAAKIKWETGASGFNAETMTAWMKGRQSDLQHANYGTEAYNNIAANIADMTTIKTIIEQRLKAGMEAADADGIMEQLWERVFDGENIPDEVWQSLTDRINEKLKELGIKPISINFKTGEENKKEDKQNKKDEKKDLSVYQDVSRIAGSVQGMLTTLEQLGVKIPDELKGIMSGVQSIIEFMSATSSFVSAVAGIKMFGFAHGGMIKAYSGTLVGNTYSGDQLRGIDNQGQLYGLNAGEVVLNRAQTGNIASQLSGNNGGGQNAQPFVTGDIIYLGLQNYLQENGYGKIVTTNMR